MGKTWRKIWEKSIVLLYATSDDNFHTYLGLTRFALNAIDDEEILNLKLEEVKITTHNVYCSCLRATSFSPRSLYMKPISADAHAGKYESILLECCDAVLKNERIRGVKSWRCRVRMTYLTNFKNILYIPGKV